MTEEKLRRIQRLAKLGEKVKEKLGDMEDPLLMLRWVRVYDRIGRWYVNLLRDSWGEKADDPKVKSFVECKPRLMGE